MAVEDTCRLLSPLDRMVKRLSKSVTILHENTTLAILSNLQSLVIVREQIACSLDNNGFQENDRSTKDLEVEKPIS